ncbi:hypothetical protein D3C86_1133760 [compost metagenome]
MEATSEVARIAAQLGEILLDPRIQRTVVQITKIPAESGFGGEGHGASSAWLNGRCTMIRPFQVRVNVAGSMEGDHARASWAYS